MQSTSYNVIKIVADEGKVFDWKKPRYKQEPVDANDLSKGTKDGEQEHLYAKTLWLAVTDSVDNYIEVDEV